MNDTVEYTDGANFAFAGFRWWQASPGAGLAGVLVLVPGSNGDGRGEVDDPFWQALARRHALALVGCCFRDRPHPDMSIERYAYAAGGSGQALLDGVAQLAGAAGCAGTAEVPLLLWGHSAGGQFNYEFVCWRPERVKAFVVNKGGYYFTHLAPPAAWAVPGILFIGLKDEAFRIHSLRGIAAVNIRAGACWTLVEAADEGHEPGRTRDLAADFFARVLGGADTAATAGQGVT